jgi:hypothetical protein
MTTTIFLALIYSVGILLVALLLLLLPLKWQAVITKPFSFKVFGIRKIKKYHSRTDTLANLLIFLSIVLCFAAPLIPHGPLVYGLWLTFTWLCTWSRAVRMKDVTSYAKKVYVIFCIHLVYGFGLLCALGMYNYYSLWIRSYLFVAEMYAGSWKNFLYYLTSPQFAAYMFNTFLLLIPVINLWGQFKYMRLENTFKSRNLFFYTVKELIVLAVILAVGIFSQPALEKVYQVDSSQRISSANKYRPDTWQEAVEIFLSQEEGS